MINKSFILFSKGKKQLIKYINLKIDLGISLL